MKKNNFLVVSFISILFTSGCDKQSSNVSPDESADATLQTQTAKPSENNQFVKVNGSQFYLNDKPYAFLGANVWYGAYLGSTNADYGDRDRLTRELDFLKALGVTNLRVLGASENSPLRDAMRPAISKKGEVENEDILVGLDFLLAEMAKRNMKAVIYLNNFWEWSGGMATYLSWVRDGEFVDMSDPNHPWPEFAWFSAQFYSEPKAVALFNHYVKTVLTRTNSVTGLAYRDDPTIMSWQLANEPRPGDGEASRPNLPAYYQWIKDTAALIKQHAPNHLVSIGSEGTMGCINLEECVINAHTDTGIDYFTFHLWLKNWGWFDVENPEQTFDSALEKAERYIQQHLKIAADLNMPAVLEEFGLERDRGAFGREATTVYRDRYFKMVYQIMVDDYASGGPFAGTNLWAWGGYGVAEHDDAKWRQGDKSFVGDPPQEPQGLNSIFVTDITTLTLLSDFSDRIDQVSLSANAEN